MKQVSFFLVFFCALSVLFGQTVENPVPQLDGAVKGVAADVNKLFAAESVGKVVVGQFVYRNATPALGSYWAAQLTEELTNIPNRSFTLFAGGSAGAEWTVSGEIVLVARTVRVYTRLIRTGDRAIMASLHSDFEYSGYFVEMLSGGGSGGGGSSSVAVDSCEPDSMANPVAVEIGVDDSVPVINRTIHDQEDQDFFLLAPDKDGPLVMETTGSIDTYMELYDAGSGNKIAGNDDGGSGDNARIRQSVRSGSRYIAKVRGYDSSETGNYGFRAYFLEQIQADPDEYEDDNDFSSAKDITIGTPQQHTFSSGDDVDWVKFQVSEAGRYVIRARGVNSNRLDTYIELFDDHHNSIDEDDDGGGNMDSRLSVRLQSGTYYLNVKYLDDEPDQPYTISITAE